MTMEDRQPLRNYEQALWRLIEWQVSERVPEGQIDLAIQIVADVFWLSDAALLHKSLEGFIS